MFYFGMRCDRDSPSAGHVNNSELVINTRKCMITLPVSLATAGVCTLPLHVGKSRKIKSLEGEPCR